MPGKMIFSWLARIPWKRVTAGVIAGTFLLPVPAFAFTFLGSWSFLQTQVNAPPATPTFSDFASGGLLQFDMGFNLPSPTQNVPSHLFLDSPFSLSTITAVRDFRITNPTEALTVADRFSALLQGSNAALAFQIIPLGNPNTTPLAFSVSNFGGIRLGGFFGDNSTRTVNLGAGDYRVTVRIKYKKNRAGFWDNTNLQSGSPYLFSFTGV